MIFRPGTGFYFVKTNDLLLFFPNSKLSLESNKAISNLKETKRNCFEIERDRSNEP